MQRIIRELRFTPFPSVVYTALGEASHHHSVMDYVVQNFSRSIDKYETTDDYLVMCRLFGALRDLKHNVFAGCRTVQE